MNEKKNLTANDDAKNQNIQIVAVPQTHKNK